jgi:hypothetical protein
VNYVFIKRYNPAYDVIIKRYFAEQGFPSTDGLTPGRIRVRARAMQGKANLTPPQKLYRDYLGEWAEFPDLKPAFYRFVDRMIGGVGQPDAKTLSKLESELAPDQGKLLFTEREAAGQIADFHSRYMANPLRRALGTQASSKVLMRYLSRSELDVLPDRRRVGTEKFEEGCRKVAMKLSARLNQITPEVIVSEISGALLEHESLTNHMKAIGEGHEKNWTCSHLCGCVELSAIALQKDALPTLFLKPAEGFLVADEMVQGGWNDYVFPSYYVKPSSSE